jgi:hypothetical protein
MSDCSGDCEGGQRQEPAEPDAPLNVSGEARFESRFRKG